jgi:hypothetical protein
MVRPFGVGDVVWKKKSDRNYWLIHGKKKVEFFFVHFSTGFQYKSYTAPNLFLS